MNFFKYNIEFLEWLKKDFSDTLKEVPNGYELNEVLFNQILHFETILINGSPTKSEIANLITTDSNGNFGGVSVKFVNILINWKRLFWDNIFDSVGAIAGSLYNRHLLIVAILSISRKIYNAREIQIDEKYSKVLMFLWKMSEREKISDVQTIDIYDSYISRKITEELFVMNERNSDRSELNRILDDLSHLRVIDYRPDGRIVLIEKIRIKS